MPPSANMECASSTIRNAKGFQLVELLVAVLILSILSAGLMDAMAKCFTGSTQTQNQILAANIAQEIIDTARDAGWNMMSDPINVADGAWHNVAVYGSTTSNPAFLPRTLMVNGNSAIAANNQFRGTVRERVTNLGGGANNGSVQLEIEVSWPAENGGGTRMLKSTSLISQNGIHN